MNDYVAALEADRDQMKECSSTCIAIPNSPCGRMILRGI